MRFLQGVVTLVFLGIAVSQRNQNCRKRAYAVESGRRCRKTCESDQDCKGIKTCQCDGACGKTCFNPNAECEKLDQILNGVFSVTKMTNGGKVTYRCDTGYVINGTTRRTCYADKNWHPPAPTCGRGCGVPGDLGNAYPTATKSEFGINEKVEYRCRTGYFMYGDPGRTCLDGGWGSVTYYCQIQVCNSLHEVYKGKISYTYGKNFGSTATLSCDTGYRAVDSYKTSARCYAGDGAYGEWNGELTSCEIKTCAPPSEPENGSIPNRFSFGRDYGTQISYKCNTGFKLEGSTTGTCDDVGTWGTMPNCTLDPDCDFQDSTQPTCGYANEGSLWKRVRVIGEDGLYGYVSEGLHRASKLTSAVIPVDWTDSQIICLKFNYKLLGSESSFEISDTTGHYLWRSHRQEIPDTWHDSLLNINTNRPIQYQFEVTSPTIQIDNLKVLQEHCDDECERHPCQNSGTCISRASGHTCFCTTDFRGSDCETDRKCSTPPKTATNANLSPTDNIRNMFLPGSSVVYRCINNFKLSGSGYSNSITTSVTTRCVERDGDRASYWNPRINYISCVEILCQRPSLNSNQYLLEKRKLTWSVGEKATVRCNEGYDFVSDQVVDTVTCRSDETWSSQFTKCQDVRCPGAARTIDNGRRIQMSDDSWFYGASATYECNRNYKFEGEVVIVRQKEVMCERRWFWGKSYWHPSISSLRCIDITCSKPQFGVNQYIYPSKAKSRVGERTTYRCSTGYEFDTDEPPPQIQVICGDDETWDRSVPACREDLKCVDPTVSISNGERISLSEKPLLPDATATYACYEGFKMERETKIILRKEIHCREKTYGLGSQWEPNVSTLNCITITCSKPQTGRNHYMQQYPSKTKWNIRERATYRCNIGYEFDIDEPPTEIQVICRDDETWDRSVPACREDLKCVDPTVQIANGKRISVSEKPLLPDATATYKCDEGFKVEGEAEILPSKEIRCRKRNPELGSQWHPDVSTVKCIRLSCTIPTFVNNQEINEKRIKWNVGENATYRCKDGYEFASVNSPITTITCGNEETWIGEATHCVEDLKCKVPMEKIPNGTRNALPSGSLLPGTNITYRCDTGYSFGTGVAAEMTVRCKQHDGERLGSGWVQTHETIQCTLIACTNIPDDRHYKALKNNTPFTPGQNTTISCVEGYKLVGDSVLICNENANWSADFPACVAITCSKPATGKTQYIQSYNSTTKWNLGERATYRCNIGYEFDTDEPPAEIQVTCSDDDTWDITVPACREDIKCVVPPDKISNSRNVSLSEKPHYPGATAAYQCKKGFKIEGETGLVLSKEIYCRNNTSGLGSQWEPDISTLNCTRIRCPPPPVNGNQKLNEGRKKWSVGKNATYQCKNGYEFATADPIRTITCGSNETWLGEVTRCIPDIKCVAPTKISKSRNVSLSEKPHLPGATAAYRCKDGFKIEGEAELLLSKEIYCRKNTSGLGSQWEPDISTLNCIRIRCTTPLVKGNQTLLKERRMAWNVGDNAMYRCKKGYEFPADDPIRNITCGSNETWLGEMTPCVEDMKCKVPNETISHGKRISLSRRPLLPGANATYWCDHGYSFGSGVATERTVRCTAKGREKLGSRWVPKLKKLFCTPAEGRIGNDLESTDLSTTSEGVSTEALGSTTEVATSSTRSSTTMAKTTTSTTEPTPPHTAPAHTANSNKIKLDFAILIPGNHYHSIGVLDDYKRWIKAIGSSLISNYDLRFSVYQYGKTYNWQVHRYDKFTLLKLDLASGSSVSSLEYAVDNMPLSDYGIYADLSASTLTRANRLRSRSGSVKVVVILIDRLYGDSAGIVSDVDCLKFYDTNVYFVGVVPAYSDTRLYEQHVEMMAQNIDNEKRWYVVRRSKLQSVVSILKRDIVRECLPPERRKVCAALPVPPQLKSGHSKLQCQWNFISRQVMYAGDKIFLRCTDGRYNWTKLPQHVQCKTDGFWHRRRNTACPGGNARRARSLSANDYINAGDCGNPDLPDRAIIINDTEIYRAGTKLILGCLNGFNLTGKQIIKCKASGVWTRTNAACKANRCIVDAFALPPNILIDGDHPLYDTYDAGETATVQCRSPLALHQSGRREPLGRAEVTCVLGGRWVDSIMEFTCETGPTICACPDVPAHAFIVHDPDNYPIGTTLTLECSVGYSPNGQNTITCHENGEWDYPSLQCEESQASICACPDLNANSRIVNDPEHYPVGISVTLACDSGYLPSGGNTISCESNGEWELPQLHCEEILIDCQTPFLPDQAVIEEDPQEYPPGTTITLDCIGYNSLVGCAQMTCNWTGEWSECESKCKATVCLLDQFITPEGMNVLGYTPIELYNNKFVVGEVASLTCSGNRFPFPRTEDSFVQPDLTCQLGGIWQPSVWTFHCIVGCQAPTEPANSQWVREPTTEVYRVGSQISFSCDEGYSYGDVSTVYCQDNGTWHEPDDACVEILIDCQTPFLPDQAVIEEDPQQYPPGTTITLDCIGDNSLVGCAQMTCNRTGEWSECESKCKANVCLLDQFITPEGMNALGYTPIELYNNKFVVGEVAALTCSGNRFPFPRAEASFVQPDLTCQLGGIWQPSVWDFHCIAGCQAPPEPANSHWVREPTMEVYRVGSQISFACDDGYSYGDVSTVECQDDGRWHEPDDACVDADDCSPNPCTNDGICLDGVKNFSCVCRSGYTGRHCDTDIDDCQPNPCKTGGHCFDRVDDFLCLCIPGFTGKICTIDIDDCDPNPCQNGGSCGDGVNDHSCICLPGYTGKNCGTDINDCDPNPCLHDGLCFDFANNYVCSCISGYSGNRCEIDIDDCSQNPCQNSGLCVDGIDNFFCSCLQGYTGKTCIIDIDDCAPNPCQNGGLCIDGRDNFICSCLQGYTGKTCSIDIDDCDPNHCMNNATCIDQVDGFLCSCLPGYIGGRCETDGDNCSPNPCRNNASCFDLVNDFLCECIPGFSGKTCESNVNDCMTNPCKNGAVCDDEVNDFSCRCAPGFSGKTCDIDVDECQENACLNNATCLDGINSYSCSCLPGYAGDRCGTNINDCRPNPCKNGAVCGDEVNDFSCRCVPGFSGKTCNIDVDECQENPCLNGATCMDEVSSYTCSCVPGYTGHRCGTNINDCLPNSCKNGAVCNDAVNDFSCRCAPGFSGKICDVDVDECQENPCLNNATCLDGINSYSCSCPPGYAGDKCGTNINDCRPNPCKNGAVCGDEVNDFSCRCVPGFSGKTCNIDVDECQENPCLNGATCMDEVNSYTCSCVPGYTGHRCGTNINDCLQNPCKNGAVCNDAVNDFSCRCAPGFSGKICDVDVDECQENPCLNNATCLDGINSYSCSCPPGYAGDKCGTNINDCSPNPCKNGAVCGDEVNDFSCRCAPGFSGKTCNIDINDCLPNTCLNGGVCEDEVNDFSCKCAPGFSGKACDIDVDECQANPCLNNATCTDGINSYSCSCVPGFTGDRCGTMIDSCNPNPCRHVERCENLINDFHCVCIPGYTGKRCESEIDECSSNPCINGGHCKDILNGFDCTCAAGYTGETCAIDINDCEPNPCQNSAGCEDKVNDFTCDCNLGYTGKLCETDIDDCKQNICQNGGVCVDGVNSFTCQCPPGTIGGLCQTNLDDCESNPCENGRFCKDFVGYFECICPSGLQGPTCSIDVDECASSPCKNHGNCNNQFGKFLCECIPGYTGTLCETEIACRHPDEQENGYWPSNNQSYSPGDILSLTCNSHFEFSGKNSRITCGFSGAWTKLEGNCIKNEK